MQVFIIIALFFASLLGYGTYVKETYEAPPAYEAPIEPPPIAVVTPTATAPIVPVVAPIATPTPIVIPELPKTTPAPKPVIKKPTAVAVKPPTPPAQGEPSGLIATYESDALGTAVTLSWSAPESAIVAKGYKIYRDSMLIGTTIELFFIDVDVTEPTKHKYTVASYDKSGNLSIKSLATTPILGDAGVVATTPSPTPTQTPVTPKPVASSSTPTPTPTPSPSPAPSPTPTPTPTPTPSPSPSPTPATCTGTTQSNCTLSGVASGGSSGSCAGGYTGSCNYSCTNGVWAQNTNSCAPPAPSPCTSTTISNCDLSGVASGGTSGSCTNGYTGSCSYSCASAAWTQVSNSCAIPLPPAAGCGSGGTCSAADVASHNTANDCWVYSSSLMKVYNITLFIPKHPGGKVAILQACGQNVEKVFDGTIGGYSGHKSNTKSNWIGITLAAYIGVFQ